MFNKFKEMFMELVRKLLKLINNKKESPRPWQWAFQTPSSTQMEGLYDLYLDIMMILVSVGVLVAYLFFIAINSWSFKAIDWMKERMPSFFTPNLVTIASKTFQQPNGRISSGTRALFGGVRRETLRTILSKFRPDVYYSHHAPIEFIWTVIPCVLLLLIAIPSFTLVLALDEDFRPWLWVKVIGNQWYWTYECSTYSTDLKAVQYDSVMVATSDLKNKYLRLLVTDTNLTIPFKRPTRFLVASNDVIHSWAVPSLGVKIDACPGRINSVTVIPTRLGVFYGQCSEICGVNHAFMPIVVQVVV